MPRLLILPQFCLQNKENHPWLENRELPEIKETSKNEIEPIYKYRLTKYIDKENDLWLIFISIDGASQAYYWDDNFYYENMKSISF